MRTSNATSPAKLSGQNGRHPLPDPDALIRTLGGLGITRGVQVVVYDQRHRHVREPPLVAASLARARSRGGPRRRIREVAGRRQRPTAAGEETRRGRSFTARPGANGGRCRRGRAASPPGDWRLVDARAPERYRGDIEPIDRVAGHIPGAVNDHFMQNLDEHGTFRPPEALRERLAAALGDASPIDDRLLLRFRRDGLSQSARARARGASRSAAVSRARGASGRAIRRGRLN